MYKFFSHVVSWLACISTGPVLLAAAATMTVADGRADEDAVETLVTNPLGVRVSVVVPLDVTEMSELLPDPPPAPPV